MYHCRDRLIPAHHIISYSCLPAFLQPANYYLPGWVHTAPPPRSLPSTIHDLLNSKLLDGISAISLGEETRKGRTREKRTPKKKNPEKMKKRNEETHRRLHPCPLIASWEWMWGHQPFSSSSMSALSLPSVLHPSTLAALHWRIHQQRAQKAYRSIERWWAMESK